MEGKIYALVIINQLAAQRFATQYPKSMLAGSPPDFTKLKVGGVSLLDEYQYSLNYFRGEGFTETEANEGALAYILDSFNADIALLKMNNDGTFSKINSEKTGGEGTNSTFSKKNVNNLIKNKSNEKFNQYHNRFTDSISFMFGTCANGKNNR